MRRRPGRDVDRQHAPHLDDEEFQGPAGASPLMENVELYSVVGRRREINVANREPISDETSTR